MKVMYNGQVIGEITTNKSMTVEEALNILDIDVACDENGEAEYDINGFELDYSTAVTNE